jgi:hypothetical protein
MTGTLNYEPVHARQEVGSSSKLCYKYDRQEMNKHFIRKYLLFHFPRKEKEKNILIKFPKTYLVDTGTRNYRSLIGI